MSDAQFQGTATLTAVPDIIPPVGAHTRRVSYSPVSGELSRPSKHASISEDSERILFTSPSDLNGGGVRNQVFLRGLLGQTLQVVDKKDLTPANASAFTPSTSGDGRYVVYHSEASNLVDGVSGSQIYLQDLDTGAVALLSQREGIPANDRCGNPQISANGLYVAFESRATNLTDVPLASGKYQIYRVEIATGDIELVSNNGVAGTQDSLWARVTEGGHVFFRSKAPEFGVASPEMICRWDGTTVSVVSTNASGTLANQSCNYHTVSLDGNHMVFLSRATNLVAGVTGTQAYYKDLVSGDVTLVSKSSGGTPVTAMTASISQYGNYVAFVSRGTVFSGIGGQQVYGYDRIRDILYMVSENETLEPGNGPSYLLPNAFAENERSILFTSFASNLVEDDTNQTFDIFVRRFWRTNPFATISFAVTATLSADAAVQIGGNASVSGHAALSAVPERQTSASLSLLGTSDLYANSEAKNAGDFSAAASATLSANPSKVATTTGSLLTGASLSALGAAEKDGTAALLGEAEVQATTSARLAGTIALQSASSLEVDAGTTTQGSVSLLGVAALAAEAQAFADITVTLGGKADLQSTATYVFGAHTSLGVESILSGLAGRIQESTATLASSASISGAGERQLGATTSLTASATVASGSDRLRSSPVALSGTASTSVSSDVPVVRGGFLSLQSSSLLQGQASADFVSSSISGGTAEVVGRAGTTYSITEAANLLAEGTLEGFPGRRQFGDAALTASATMAGTLEVLRFKNVIWEGTSALTGNPIAVFTGNPSLEGSSSLEARPVAIFLSSSALAGSANLQGRSGGIYPVPDAASLTGDAGITADNEIIRFKNVIWEGIATLDSVSVAERTGISSQVGEASMSPFATATFIGDTDLQGASTLQAVPERPFYVDTIPALEGVAGIAANNEVIRFKNVIWEGKATFTALVEALRSSSVSLEPGVNLTAGPIALYSGTAPLTGIANLEADGQSFTPGTDLLGDEYLWLDVFSLSLEEGDPVLEWQDSSINGHDFFAATGKEPVYILDQDGVPAVSFEGTKRLEGPLDLVRNIAEFTVVVVAKALSTDTENKALFYASNGTAEDQTRIGLFHAHSHLVAGGKRADGDTYKEITGGSTDVGTWKTQGLDVAWTSRDLRLYDNGSIVNTLGTFGNSSGNTSDTDSVVVTIGETPGGDRYFDGYIRAVVAYDRVLSVEEMSDLQVKLAARYFEDITYLVVAARHKLTYDYPFMLEGVGIESTGTPVYAEPYPLTTDTTLVLGDPEVIGGQAVIAIQDMFGTDLEALWLHYEGEEVTLVPDLSGNGNEGTVVGSVGFRSSSLAKDGFSATFDSTSRISVPNSPGILKAHKQGGTLFGWAHVNDIETSTLQVLLANNGGSSNNRGIQVAYGNRNGTCSGVPGNEVKTVNFLVSDAAGTTRRPYACFFRENVINTNTFFWCIAYDGVDARLYINGVLEDTLVAATPMPIGEDPTFPLGIGSIRGDANVSNLDGRQQLVGYASRKATATEMADLYNAIKPTP
jgi:Tol biopolymer transport system component